MAVVGSFVPAIAAGSKAPAALPLGGALPDKANFPIEGTYLDAAFCHPAGRFARAAAQAYVDARFQAPQAFSPRQNTRKEAVERFARLINADPADIAVVPSTLEGENRVNAALGIGADAGVVTDGLHYDGALALYGELARRGTPVGVVRPREGRIDLADVARLITPKTRLIAVSLVSSTSGFLYDLAELCALAHACGVLVYADIIQAAGAVPIDVRASGVDFACCGTYKWLMGDFGAAFFYVRADRLDRLVRPAVGWRSVRSQQSHNLPLDPPGPALDDYELAGGAAGLFEVSTPAWGPLAVATAGIDHILGLGVEAIVRHRRPLLARIREGLPREFVPLTDAGSASPYLSFAVRDARSRFGPRLAAERIKISTYPNRIRISPSVYNDEADTERVIRVLSA